MSIDPFNTPGSGLKAPILHSRDTGLTELAKAIAPHETLADLLHQWDYLHSTAVNAPGDPLYRILKEKIRRVYELIPVAIGDAEEAIKRADHRVEKLSELSKTALENVVALADAEDSLRQRRADLCRLQVLQFEVHRRLFPAT